MSLAERLDLLGDERRKLEDELKVAEHGLEEGLRYVARVWFRSPTGLHATTCWAGVAHARLSGDGLSAGGLLELR